MADDVRNGYVETFLGDGFTVPMPTAGPEIAGDVLTRDGLRDGTVADYIHYSVVMGRENRQALFSAANLDQSQYRTVKGRHWFIDSRIGAAHQVGNEAYRDNDWDKGHLTRRTAVTWGESDRIAHRASNDSCSYANASMQHANFNRDEWRLPEDVVSRFDRDRDGRLCIFTGPVFTEIDRFYVRRGTGVDGAVRIPSAFWKVIAYVGKASGKLESQAYLMYQDDLFLADRRTRRRINVAHYQVTVTELEHRTGLEFPEHLYHANPLYFAPRPDEGVHEPEALLTRRTEALAHGVMFDAADRAKGEITGRRKRLRGGTLG